MEIKYQEKGYSVMSGAPLLRQIQNEHTPTIDLLIRESVQNSLDAARKSSKTVYVNFMTGPFQTTELSPFLKGISSLLNQYYPGEQEFLAIKDTGTVGLTGPVSITQTRNERFGNLQSLVYQIAKAQQSKGAGGSWGIGKTVYFRVGNGLVFYYSRIINNETRLYEERLAATLVEDENKPKLLVDNPNRSGIAWWGEPDPELEKEGKEGTIPLIDSPEIHEILKVFGLQPMRDDETGTMIIIPFVDPGALLSQTLTEAEQLGEAAIPYWKGNLSSCLKICLQKWYCPRLDNPEYSRITGNPVLQASVNGDAVREKTFLPLFQLIQRMYNSTPDHPLTFRGARINSEDILLRNAFESTGGKKRSAGILSSVKVTEQELDMLPPENLPGPYADIDRDSPSELNEPILAYMRRPGMVISYETDSTWTHSMPKAPHGEFIIAAFRSSQDTVLKKEFHTDEITTLEDYLRKTENADHMSWNDLDLNRRKTGIVKKIRTNLINKISSHYKEAVQATDRRQNLSLGKIIGSKILPAEGSGYWDDRGGGSSGPGGTGGDGDTSTPDIQGTMGTVTGFKMSVCGAVEYRGSQVCIPVQLSFGKRDQGILSVAVQTEAGRRTADYWAKNVGTLYPVWIDALEINRIEKGRKKFRNTHAEPEAGSVESMAEIHNSTVFQNIEFEFEKGNGGPGCHSVRIQVPEADHYRLFCAVVVSVSDLEAVLDFKKVTDPGKKEAEK